MSALKKIWELLGPTERRGAVVLFGLTLAGMVLETIGIGLIVPALAVMTQSDITVRYPVLAPVLSRLGYPSQEVLISAGMAILLIVYIIKSLFLAFLAWRQTRFALDVQIQLSRRVFAAYLYQPYTFHLQRNSAQLIRNITSEINLFIFSGMIPGILLLTEVLVSVGLIILLLAVEPFGAVMVVSVTGFLTLLFHRFSRSHLERWGGARQYHEGMRIQHLQQGLGGVRDVKTLGREREFLENYHVHNQQSARAMELQLTLQQMPRLWLELLAVMGFVMVVVSMLVQDRGVSSLLPALGLFAAVAFRLLPSVNRAIASIQTLRFTMPVIDLLWNELRIEATSTPVDRRVGGVSATILKLDEVGYTYPGGNGEAVKGVCIEVRRGESIGLIGSSGSGKSTIVDLILGLLTPDRGSILVDGESVYNRLRSWQDQVGYVPQTIYLMDDTLRRNIAFGLQDDRIDESCIWRALAASQLEDFVAGLPEGLDTLVGERGVRLSGGQRQRIGIARALYNDPKVLILDEATSSLDTRTEEEVMRSIRALREEKMIVIVAHRLSTVAHCDRLYRLEHGEVVMEGRPEAVVKGALRAIDG